MTDVGWPEGPTDAPAETPLGWPDGNGVGPVVNLDPSSPVQESPADVPDVPDYRPVDLATDPIPAVTGTAPIDRIRAVLRDDTESLAHTSVTGLGEDTPIGVAAAAAVRVLNPGGRDDFPKPAHRRILTIANQK
ncbi:MAG: hypothetical protein QOE99_224, partial [Actinomycetota bacterium]|nr:hypothetical protein [Actinomycetota bacterium]